MCTASAPRLPLKLLASRYTHTHPRHEHTHPIDNSFVVSIHACPQVAACIGAAGPQDITFTSGGTEAINWALLGVIATTSAASGKPCHIVSTVIEHVAVLRTLDALKAQGHSVTLLPVDVHGQVTPEQVVAALQDDTALITIMHANNEVQ